MILDTSFLPGELRARAASEIDRVVPTVDAIIAAVADLHDEPVLTANVEDFEGLGVAVETY